MNDRKFDFRGVATNDAPFRGLAVNVENASTVDEALDISHLNWKVVPVKYERVGKKERRPSRFFGLTRTDNEYEIAPCSATYTPIQNRSLMAAFFRAAGEAGVHLKHAGSMYGGARVFASAEMEASFTLPVGKAWEEAMRRNPDHGWVKDDRTVLELTMMTGHEPGYKARLSAIARRKVCENGAEVTEVLGQIAMAHRGHVNLKLFDVAARIGRMREGFERYAHKARILRDTKSTREIDRAYAVQLMAPAAWNAIVAETEERVHGAHPGRLSGTDLLNAVVERTYTEKFEAALRERSVAAILDAIETQPGAAMAAGTLWNSYNAVTYHVDHRAGRSVDSGLQSALYGDGNKLKTRALDTVLQYAEAAGARGVVNGQVVD